MTSGSASASSIEWSFGCEPTCMSTISPGVAASSTRAVVNALVRMPFMVPCQPMLSTVQRTAVPQRVDRGLRPRVLAAEREAEERPGVDAGDRADALPGAQYLVADLR